MKPKVAFYWCASCGGCEEAVLDLNEEVLNVANAVDIAFWPVALDTKYTDIEAMDNEDIDVSFINGAIRTSEQEKLAKLLRKKSKLVVAFGSCAHLGGIPALANLYDRESIFKRVYGDAFFNNTEQLDLPEFYDEIFRLNEVIDVDYYIPGCPPPADIIKKGIDTILSGELPSKGSILAAEDKSLCNSCERNETKPENLKINEVKRPWEVELDPEKCFLEQGVICLGPVTRTGCGERCINANMPCRGCFGPVGDVEDHGLRALSTIASIVGVEGEEDMSDEEVEEIISKIVDPAGTFYRFSLPKSLLNTKKRRQEVI